MSQPELAELYRLIRELTANVAGMAVTVARIEERMNASEDIEGRVKTLELDKAKVEGVGMAAKALWAFVGAGGIGFLVVIYHVVTKTPVASN